MRERSVTALVGGLVILATACGGNAKTLDGIMISRFDDPQGHEAIAQGEYLVTFISGHGTYASIAWTRQGSTCQSLGVPGTYSGDSISFGIDADKQIRTVRLQTYCPSFSVNWEGGDTIRVEARDGAYRREHQIIAHIPLQEIDFEAEPYTTHDIKGVRLGPVLNPEEVLRLSAPGGPADRVQGFRRVVETAEGEAVTLSGSAAAAEITGWPWPVLFRAKFLDQFERPTPEPVFRELVLERYGEPSSIHPNVWYAFWLYDLSGNLLDPAGEKSGACLATADFWLERDPLGRVTQVKWGQNSHDLGPWGCGLMFALRPNRSDGGVTGYSVEVLDGYVMALNHFLQRFSQLEALKAQIEAVVSAKPKF